MTYIIPMRCVPKQRPRDRNFHMPEPYKEWKRDFAVCLLAQGPHTPLKGRLQFIGRICFKGKAGGDTDNYLGAIWDAAQGILYANDRQIRRINCELVEDSEDRIEFSVSPL